MPDEQDLKQRLETALENAARACCTARPSAGEDPGYHFGRLQGKFAGLREALKILDDVTDDDFGDDDEGEEGEEITLSGES